MFTTKAIKLQWPWYASNTEHTPLITGLHNEGMSYIQQILSSVRPGSKFIVQFIVFSQLVTNHQPIINFKLWEANTTYTILKNITLSCIVTGVRHSLGTSFVQKILI